MIAVCLVVIAAAALGCGWVVRSIFRELERWGQ